MRGIVLRLVLVILFTWIVGAIIESFWTALIWALLPLCFHEVLRPRPDK